ncbi:MAG TPA: hypothetical protein VIV82_01700 [Verrucomicrobiae bacterium]
MNLAQIKGLIFVVLAGCVIFQAGAADPVFMDFTNTPSPPAIDQPLPESARELFNLGTRRLRAVKLTEAEAALEKALETQDERVRAPAVYNLGETRFQQGAELLKKGPEKQSTLSRGWSAAQTADHASQRATEALASNDVQQMLAAYLNGRGARRELRSASEAIRRALEVYGTALQRWQRSLDDFKSAAELNRADTNALHNAELVEREIVKLIDSIREMQQAAQKMAQSQQGLREKLKQLGGKIPESMMPPGARGDDEEDGEGKRGKDPGELPPGMKEPGSRPGSETPLSAEEAGWLLDSFKLDGNRRLPMNQGETGEPQNRKGRNW